MPLESPPCWRELFGSRARINAGEYAVYHFFAKSLVRCTPNGTMLDGSNEVGYVFDGLADARRYCQWKVNGNPKLACTIYDAERKVVDQVYSSQHLHKISRANDPTRRLAIGMLQLVAGVALIWIDARHDWMLIIGFLVGARLAVGGIVKVALVATDLQGRRGGRKAEPRTSGSPKLPEPSQSRDKFEPHTDSETAP
jgi:hypothetical protein